MPLTDAECDPDGCFLWFVRQSPLEGGSQFSPCPEASASSPSAAVLQTAATSGSGSPVGSDQLDADQQSVICGRRKIVL